MRAFFALFIVLKVSPGLSPMSDFLILTSYTTKYWRKKRVLLLIFLLTEESGPESSPLVIFSDRTKKLLQQQMMSEEGQRDVFVAKQPLWLLFCCAGPLTRFFQSRLHQRGLIPSQLLETCINQRWELLLLMLLLLVLVNKRIGGELDRIWHHRERNEHVEMESNRRCCFHRKSPVVIKIWCSSLVARSTA